MWRWRRGAETEVIMGPRLRGDDNKRGSLSALEHFHLCGRPRAQEHHVARDCDEAHTALGERDGTLGTVAIGPGNLAGLLGGRDDVIDLAVDILREWVERAAIRQRNREIGRAKKQPVNTRRPRDRVNV